jgi:hypothetical protein
MIPKMDERNNLSKWDLLHMESKKNLAKRDLPDDEIRLMREQQEYTFQPNSRRQRHSPPQYYARSGSSVNSSFQRPQTHQTSRKKMFNKPPLDQGRKRLSSMSPKRATSRYSNASDEKGD